MFFRLVTTTPFPVIDGIDLNKTSYKGLINKYLCIARNLACTKVDFLCFLPQQPKSYSPTIEHNQLIWIPKVFDELTAKSEFSHRTINRIITFLRQEKIFLTKKLTSRKTICTNYIINYPELWKLIPQPKERFASLLLGDAA